MWCWRGREKLTLALPLPALYLLSCLPAFVCLHFLPACLPPPRQRAAGCRPVGLSAGPGRTVALHRRHRWAKSTLPKSRYKQNLIKRD